MYTLEALFFPGKIVLVDDDKDFLKSVSHHLKEIFQIETFSDPKQALNYIIENQKKLENLNLSAFAFDEDQDTTETRLDLTKIQDFSRDSNKNNVIMLILSDYDMKKMNGIELFEQISSTSVMRILLTGKADLKLALDAFNRGLVDKFLIKDTEKMLDEIIMNIKACQKSFFEKLSYPILSHLNIPIDSLLNRNDFSFHFMEFVKNNDIKEYYLIDTTGSFLLKTKTGDIKYFICMLDRQFDDYLSYAASRADQKILDGLKNRTHAPVFRCTEDYKLPIALWDKITYPFEKGDGYYFCITEK